MSITSASVEVERNTGMKVLVYVSRAETTGPGNRIIRLERHERPLGKLMEDRRADWERS
jgi:hypothetical protein